MAGGQRGRELSGAQDLSGRSARGVPPSTSFGSIWETMTKRGPDDNEDNEGVSYPDNLKWPEDNEGVRTTRA